MSYSTNPKKIEGKSKVKEDGFYVHFSMEKDILNWIHPKNSENRSKTWPHHYNVMIVKEDMRGEKYLIRFGSCENPFNYLEFEKFLLKQIKFKIRSNTFYPYNNVIQDKFKRYDKYNDYDEEGNFTKCDHKNPVKNSREFYDLSLEGCRCYLYLGLICRCSNEGKCKCVSDSMNSYMRRVDNYELVSECKLVDYFGISNLSDPIQTGRELCKIDFRDFLAIDSNTGIIDIRKWTSPIEDEISEYVLCQCKKCKKDNCDCEDCECECEDCDYCENTKNNKSKVVENYVSNCEKVKNIEEYMIDILVKNEDESNNGDFDSFEQLINHVKYLVNYFSELGLLCRFCGEKNCNEVLKDFFNTSWLNIHCNSCSKKMMFKRYYECQECSDYDLCDTCYNSGVHSNHVFGRCQKKINELSYKIEKDYEIVGHASSIQVNDDYYLSMDKDNDGSIIGRYLYDSWGFSNNYVYYYYYSLLPNKPVDDERCTKRLMNWRNVMDKAKKLHLL
tara:strand:+ start:4047 stop:5552 length:1506 start_codon:yes stop_codon:yes gene_type:complete